jgi:hypothetical protein
MKKQMKSPSCSEEAEILARDRWTNLRFDQTETGGLEIFWVQSCVLPSGYRGKIMQKLGGWSKDFGWISLSRRVCVDLDDFAKTIRVPGVRFSDVC